MVLLLPRSAYNSERRAGADPCHWNLVETATANFVTATCISRLRPELSTIRGIDMRRALGFHVPAPSSSLLRFLRSQTEDLCFFTSNSRANTCHCVHYRSGASLNLTSTPRRHLNTTTPRQAVVQPSLLNPDNPTPSRRRDAPASLPPPPSINRLWPCVPSDNSFNQSTSRYASTDARPLLKRILGRRKAVADLPLNDLPPLPSFLDDVNGPTLGRSKAAKNTNELKLRCTEFNEDGKVTLVNGEFKKTELIAKVFHVPIERIHLLICK